MGVPMMAGVRKSSKVTPFAPQVKPMAKPGTFIDAQFDGVSPASKPDPASGVYVAASAGLRLFGRPMQRRRPRRSSLLTFGTSRVVT